MKRRAFISVYDKIGLIDFARNLTDRFNYEIVACGDTFEFLHNAGISVIDANDFSGCPGLLSNEAEIVSENLIAGILCNSSSVKELDELESFAVKSFDMVVVNLRPFDDIKAQCPDLNELLSKVDIGGCTLLRAAAKNYKNVTVIADKADYYVALNTNDFGRLKLALKAFNITSDYDRLIAREISEQTGEKSFKTFTFEKINDLQYGENPQQNGAVYKNGKMVDYEVIKGSELNFNDILNVTSATNIVSEFYDVNAAAIVRHAKPCGVALGRSLYEAYNKAFDCDPISSFYGTAAFSKVVDEEVARHLNSMAVEVVVAPDFEDKAIEWFADNPLIKLVKLKTSLKEYRELIKEEIIMTPYGTLVQDTNTVELDKNSFNIVTTQKPTKEQIEDAIFAWKVAKHSRTNSVVVARDFKTFAIAQGQTNTVVATEFALNYACDNSKEAVLASDAALYAEDCIYSAIQNRISLIIQPGGTPKDQKLIEVCDKYGIAMIFTGVRNYKQ